MLELVLTIVFTALASSLLTLALLGWYLRRRVLPDAEERLAALLAEEGDRLGEVIEDRVRRGARDGLKEGIASIPAEGLSQGIQGATQTVGRAAMNLMGTGLSGLMGGGKRPPEDG